MASFYKCRHLVIFDWHMQHRVTSHVNDIPVIIFAYQYFQQIKNISDCGIEFLFHLKQKKKNRRHWLEQKSIQTLSTSVKAQLLVCVCFKCPIIVSIIYNRCKSNCVYFAIVIQLTVWNVRNSWIAFGKKAIESELVNCEIVCNCVCHWLIESNQVTLFFLRDYFCLLICVLLLSPLDGSLVRLFLHLFFNSNDISAHLTVIEGIFGALGANLILPSWQNDDANATQKQKHTT